MKIGELYYGLSIPQNEFRKVEQQLRRFEDAVKAAGGRGAAQALTETQQAAARAAQAIQELSGTWATLRSEYNNSERAVGSYIDRARELIGNIDQEMSLLKENSNEHRRLANLKSTIANAITSESKALTRLGSITGETMETLRGYTKETLRHSEASQTLAGRYRTLQGQLQQLESARRRQSMSETEILAGLQQLMAVLDEEARVIRESNAAWYERERALGGVAKLQSQAQNSIDRVQLSMQGYNRLTLQGINVTDGLTRAWLIGLGPQGYRLYLVLDVLHKSMRDMSTAVRAAQGAFVKLNTILKFSVIGTMMAVAGAVIAGINQMMRIEDTMADVRKTTGLTADDLSALEQAFRALSLELPATTNELGEIAVQAGMLGIRGAKNIFEFTRAIAELKLAVTGLGEDAAVTMGRFLNILGVPLSEVGEKANEVAGVLNELENNTASTAGEILDMAQVLAQVSGVAGFTARDVLATAAALRSMGLEAALVGSNLTRIMINLVTDVAKGTDTMTRWAQAAGMTRDEFRELAMSQNGYSKALQATTQNMGQANLSAEELTAALERLGITNVRERRIITALVQGWRTYQHAIELANDETATAESIQNELAVRLDVTRVQLQLLRNRFSAMVQVIGAELLPTLSGAIKGFNTNADAIGTFGAGVLAVTDLIKAAVEFIVGLVKVVGAPFIAAIEQMGHYGDAVRGFMETIRGAWALLKEGMWDTAITVFQAGMDGIRASMEEAELTVKIAERIPELIREGFQQMGKSFITATDAFTKWEERKNRIVGGMVELIDQLDEFSALGEGGIIDEDLFKDFDELSSATAKTADDVMRELGVLMEAIDRMADVMAARGLEFDANVEKQQALEAALRELVMAFGETANSPNTRAVLQMLRDLGLDAEQALSELRALQEWLTKNWVSKLQFMVEYGAMSPQQALHEVTTAVIRLKDEMHALINMEGQRDWLSVASLNERIVALERLKSALEDNYTILSDIVGISDEDPLPDKGEIDEVTMRFNSLTEAMDAWEELTREALDPIEALRLKLIHLARGTDFVAERAKAMLAVFNETFYPPEPPPIIGIDDDFVNQKELDAVTRGLEIVEGVWDELNQIIGESVDPLEAFHRKILALSNHSLPFVREEMRRLLATYHDLLHGTQDLPIIGIDDDRTPDPDPIERQLEIVNGLWDEWNNVMVKSKDSTTALHDALFALSNSILPLVAAEAGRMLAVFEETFHKGVQKGIDSTLEMNALLRSTMPAGSYRELEAALSDVRVEIDHNEAALRQAVATWRSNSKQAQHYADILTELRAREAELTIAIEEQNNVRLQLERDQEAWLNRRLETQGRLEDAIRNIQAAVAPQLTQTQRQIQQYEQLAALMDGPMARAFEKWIDLLRDKDTAESQEALAAAQRQVAELAGETTDQFQRAIPTLEALAETYPKIAEEIALLIEQLEQLSISARKQEGKDFLSEASERVAQMAGRGKNQFQAFIEELRKGQERYPEMAHALDTLIDTLQELDDEFSRNQGLNDFNEALTKIFAIASTLLDLFSDGNWTDGNKLLEAATGIASQVASFIDPTGTLGSIIETVGGFLNSVLGDMSNGMKQVAQQIEQIADRSAFIGRELAERLTVTKQVSRGGILGWLGFTKTAIDEELTKLNMDIANSFGSALKSGIMAALQGDTEWQDKLRDGLKAAIADALLNAFIESMLLTAGMADFIEEFTRILTTEGAAAAGEYARANMGRVLNDLEEGARIIIENMRGMGFDMTPRDKAGDDGFAKEQEGTHGFFTLPTATPGLISATPAWVDNLGMHFAKFGMWVDRLVNEGITVHVGEERVRRSGGARDVRLSR
jgi:TP901 family phage tail tape measure protein